MGIARIIQIRYMVAAITFLPANLLCLENTVIFICKAVIVVFHKFVSAAAFDLFQDNKFPRPELFISVTVSCPQQFTSKFSFLLLAKNWLKYVHVQ